MKKIVPEITKTAGQVKDNFSNSLAANTGAWVKIATLIVTYLVMSNYSQLAPLVASLLVMTLIGRPLSEIIQSLNFLKVVTDLFPKKSPAKVEGKEEVKEENPAENK